MTEFWKRYHTEIIIIAMMVVVGSCMHFVCDIISNEKAVNILGVIFPVNETTWEHMKMIWYPFLVVGIVLSITKKNRGYFGGFVLSGITAMLVMIGAFSIYQSFTVTSVLLLDIFLFFCFYDIVCPTGISVCPAGVVQKIIDPLDPFGCGCHRIYHISDLSSGARICLFG